MASMNVSALVSLATIAGSLAIGRFAVNHLRRQGRPVWAGLGLKTGKGALAEFAAGLGIAAAVMLGVFAVESGLGGLRITAEPLFLTPTIIFALILPPLAFLEEFLNRVLLLTGLVYLLKGRSSLAIVVSAIIFGLAHAANPGASVLSVIGNALGGAIYGIAFVRTGRVWLPLGLHVAWNVVQGPVLGFPVSGHTMGGLQHVADLGPAWLTGGEYGPEAGLVGVAARIVIIATLVGWSRSRQRMVAAA